MTPVAAAARDAVKKEALRRAGIGYHEVQDARSQPGFQSDPFTGTRTADNRAAILKAERLRSAEATFE